MLAAFETLIRHSVLSSRKFRAWRETPRESRMHRKQRALKHLPTISEGKVRKKRKNKEKGKVSESRCSVWGEL